METIEYTDNRRSASARLVDEPSGIEIRWNGSTSLVADVDAIRVQWAAAVGVKGYDLIEPMIAELELRRATT